MEQPSRFKVIIANLWPSIYRAINSTVYFIFHTLIDTIQRMIEQIK